MPRRSTILDSPDLTEIHAALLAGDRSVLSIASQFALSPDALWRYARRLRSGPPVAVDVGPGADDPLDLYRRAFGQEPMPHQAAVLTDSRPTIFLKGRQVGATQAAAALAIHTASSRASADVIVVSTSQRQSGEIGKRARDGFYALGELLVQDSVSLLRLANGSRIISLPGNSRGIRGYAPALVICDEAAWVEDDTYAALRPMLAASGGRLLVQSTPAGPVGWFYDLWSGGAGDDWLRLEVRSDEVPTITPEFLERERRELPPDVYAQEYMAEFTAPGLGLISEEYLAGLTVDDDDDDDSPWKMLKEAT